MMATPDRFGWAWLQLLTLAIVLSASAAEGYVDKDLLRRKK